jgi:hypothetical protein
MEKQLMNSAGTELFSKLIYAVCLPDGCHEVSRLCGGFPLATLLLEERGMRLTASILQAAAAAAGRHSAYYCRHWLLGDQVNILRQMVHSHNTSFGSPANCVTLQRQHYTAVTQPHLQRNGVPHALIHLHKLKCDAAVAVNTTFLLPKHPQRYQLPLAFTYATEKGTHLP